MSTNQDKVRGYYAVFDEWARLETPEGALEFRSACQLLHEHLPAQSRVLDLGGGPGRYSVALAQAGHRVVLADLSPRLLEVAKAKFESFAVASAIDAIDEVNAQDLSRYANASFDAVLAFGPFYHLVTEDERSRAARELTRVVRPGGLVFVAYLPRVSGVAGLIERASTRPDQVTADVIREAAQTGVFRNRASTGFKEGYYPLVGELEALLRSSGLRVDDVVSLKSIGNGLGLHLTSLGQEMTAAVRQVADALNRDKGVIATCGHVVIVARRPATGADHVLVGS